VFKSWILGFQIDFPASIFGVGYSAFATSFRFNDVTLLTNHPANTLGSPRALFRTCGSEPPPSCSRTFRYHSIMSTSKS